MEISFKQTLFSIEPRNQRCVDCGDKNITYVSINNGITICELCSQIHKQLGPKISNLHKIDEEIDDDSMNYFIYGGNKKFKKTLKKLGVDLDMQRSKLYRTYGVDYYRKCLKSKVKGIENKEKCPDNPNELMKIENNNEIIDFNINNDNKGSNKEIIDNSIKKNEEKSNKINENKDSVNNINNFLNINNNLGHKTKVEEIDKGESHIQLNLHDNPNINSNDNNKEYNRKKSLLRSSINKVKNFGGYIRKNSAKSIVVIKKAGNILVKKSKPAAEKIKSTAKYVGEHMPYFHKHKIKSQEDIRSKNDFDDNYNDIKEDKKNENELEDVNQIEF